MWKVQYRVMDRVDPTGTLLLGTAAGLPLSVVMERLGRRIEGQLDVLNLCDGLDPEQVIVMMVLTEPPHLPNSSSLGEGTKE